MKRSIRSAIVTTGVLAVAVVPTSAAFASSAPATGAPGVHAALPEHGQKTKRIYVKTVHLKGGFTAKVYKVRGNYEADLRAKVPGTNKVKTWQTLRTKGGKPAYGEANGVRFVLDPNGGVRSWTDSVKPKPAKRVYVQSYALAGGMKGKVYKVGSNYEADIMPRGTSSVWDTLKSRGGKPAYGEHNGAHFVLNPNGTMKSWVDEDPGPNPPAPNPNPDDDWGTDDTPAPNPDDTTPAPNPDDDQTPAPNPDQDQDQAPAPNPDNASLQNWG
ncbi:hypothetical protein G5C51_21905 [Streptomyces sp. A7024]|uniref:Uncharacterized protein n=1 Tax=Streptomyces coryli TaxID=1128680 RepID=A0A6G4U386_9ACTN|nr:hypothetical protein [Streptomyces coryli]NGN66543.1 hypothetical protein [Streptomyces coryli]